MLVNIAFSTYYRDDPLVKRGINMDIVYNDICRELVKQIGEDLIKASTSYSEVPGEKIVTHRLKCHILTEEELDFLVKSAEVRGARLAKLSSGD